jgi:hypothetical protein
VVKKRVPEFNDISEMARFFDETDSAELDLGPMERGEYEPKRVVLSIRLDASDDIDLARLARRMGADKSTLIRMIIKQFFRNHHDTHGSSGDAARS